VLSLVNTINRRVVLRLVGVLVNTINQIVRLLWDTEQEIPDKGAARFVLGFLLAHLINKLTQLR
jgi:hypothetical protein